MMTSPGTPDNEDDRLASLRELCLLDTPPEERFDRITRLAKRLSGAPIALFTLIDRDRQWSKSHQGIEIEEVPRDTSFCAHTILGQDTLIIRDTERDERFRGNPFVTGEPRVRFYAGHPVRAPDGHAIGSLCVIDYVPRHLGDDDLQGLRDLAGLLESELRLLGVDAVRRDLEDATSARRELVARLRLADLAIQQAPIGIVVTDTRAPENPIVSANAGFLELTGYSLQEVMGRDCRFLQGEATDPAARKEISAALREERAGRVDLINYRKDGTRFWNRLTVAPVRDEAGDLIHYVGVQLDITAQRTSEEEMEAEIRDRVGALREERARLALFVENTPAAVAMFDREMRYLMVSHRWCEDYGLEGERLIGRSHYEVFPDIDREWKEVHQRCLAGAVERRRADRFARSDGTTDWVDWEIHPWREADGSVGGIIMFTEVMTEQVRADEEMRRVREQFLQAQKMEAVGRLAGGIAHDFNNMLSAIIGFNDLSLQLVPSDHPVAGHLREVRRAGRRASALTGQLLAFSRKKDDSPEPISVDELVESMHSMVERLLPPAVELRLELAGDLSPVPMHRSQLEQVLLNLVVNAYDAMPEGGEIVIRTEGEEGSARLIVADSGVGIDEETLPKIFEPFFTTKEEGKGTGLGLSTVYGIVEQSGGRIDVDSHPGRGTRFVLHLPADSTAGQAAPEAGVRPRPEPGRGRILLAEDEPAVRRLLCLYLEAEGYDIAAGGDADEALELWERRSQGFDVLMTDIALPGRDGRWLAGKVRETRPDLPVVFLTDEGDDLGASIAELSGRWSVIQKPIRPVALLHEIANLLTLRDTTDSASELGRQADSGLP